MRLSDVLKRKRPKTTARMHTGVWRKTRQEDNSSSTFSEFLMKSMYLLIFYVDYVFFICILLQIFEMHFSMIILLQTQV